MKRPAAEHSPEPWHSVRLMWFVVGLPTVVVIAGLFTLFLAIRDRDVVVRDDFRPEGLVIYPDPKRDAAAAALGASATLTFDAAAGRLRVELALRRGTAPGSLVVILSHATRARLDQMLTVTGSNGVYSGTLAPLLPGHWYVEVTPEDRGWRLKGDFQGSGRTLRLKAPGVS